MAKKRDDRYANTADMLDDLVSVRAGQPPTHARRTVDLEQLIKLESGKTVDIAPQTAPPAGRNVWQEPIVLIMAGIAGASVIANLILLAVMLSRH